MDNWLKRQAEIAVSAGAVFGVLGALFMGIVRLTDGRFPPWATPDEVKRLVSAGVVNLQGYVDLHDCDDYNGRFVRAQQALQRNHDDKVAADLFNASRDKIRTIPNCMPEILPAEPPQKPPDKPGGTIIVP